VGRVYAFSTWNLPFASARSTASACASKSISAESARQRPQRPSSVPPQVHVDKRAEGSKYGDARATAHRIDSVHVSNNIATSEPNVKFQDAKLSHFAERSPVLRRPPTPAGVRSLSASDLIRLWKSNTLRGVRSGARLSGICNNRDYRDCQFINHVFNKVPASRNIPAYRASLRLRLIVV